MNPRRLYRSRDRQLAGVAGGMAEYLDIDPTVVRILWILVGIASGGFALLVYFVLALVTPSAPYAMAPAGGAWAPAGASAGWQPAPSGAPADWAPPAATSSWGQQPGVAPAPAPRAERRGFGAAAIVGVVLIVFGAIALADAALPGWVAGAIIGPAVILALGAALLVSSLRRPETELAAASVQQAGPSGAAFEAPAAPVDAPAASVDAPATPAEPASWDVADTQAVGPSGVAVDPGARPA